MPITERGRWTSTALDERGRAVFGSLTEQGQAVFGVLPSATVVILNKLNTGFKTKKSRANLVPLNETSAHFQY